jgi:excinuclease UvrABC helicase subunit UvrB
MRFELASEYEPCGDQPKAIEAIVSGLDEKKKLKSF